VRIFALTSFLGITVGIITSENVGRLGTVSVECIHGAVGNRDECYGL
jgi:hypothetical protein